MSATTQPSDRPNTEQSLGELVALMTRDLSILVNREIELAKAEIGADMKRAGIGAGFLGGGGFLAYFGALFASVAAAFGIHRLGPGLGWSFLIVAGAHFLLAALLAVLGVRSVTRIAPPRRTIESVKDGIAWARHPRNDRAGGAT